MVLVAFEGSNLIKILRCVIYLFIFCSYINFSSTHLYEEAFQFTNMAYFRTALSDLQKPKRAKRVIKSWDNEVTGFTWT